MDQIAPKDRDLIVDLEIGGTARGEDGSVKGEDGVSLCSNGSNSGMIPKENVKVFIDKNLVEKEAMDSVDKKAVKEKRKKPSNKKSSKPPRPPKGPSLDAADQKLVREIAELAMLKRARVERRKALRKMKVAKASSNSSLFAMVFTVFFCLVILFQGLSSRRNSAITFHGSPESAAPTEGGLISVQYYHSISPSDVKEHGSESPGLVEELPGLEAKEKAGKAPG